MGLFGKKKTKTIPYLLDLILKKKSSTYPLAHDLCIIKQNYSLFSLVEYEKILRNFQEFSESVQDYCFFF
jgi:hypothetical protein